MKFAPAHIQTEALEVRVTLDDSPFPLTKKGKFFVFGFGFIYLFTYLFTFGFCFGFTSQDTVSPAIC